MSKNVHNTPKQIRYVQFFDQKQSILDVKSLILSANSNLKVKHVHHRFELPTLVLEAPEYMYEVFEGWYVCVNENESDVYVLTQKEFMQLGKSIRGLDELENINEKVSG